MFTVSCVKHWKQGSQVIFENMNTFFVSEIIKNKKTAQLNVFHKSYVMR